MKEKIQVKLARKTADIKILKGEGLVDQVLPPHSADNEAQLIMVTGKILFTLAEQSYVLQAGDLQVIPANKVHSVEVKAACQFYLVLTAATKMSFLKPTT